MASTTEPSKDPQRRQQSMKYSGTNDEMDAGMDREAAKLDREAAKPRLRCGCYALFEGRVVHVGMPARGLYSTRHTSVGRVAESLLRPIDDDDPRILDAQVDVEV